MVRVAVRVVTGAGFAAAARVVRAVRFTVRVVAVVAVRVDVSDAGAVVLSVACAGWSAAGAGWAVAGAGWVAAGGAGCASWASTWVEESARAAAIAGKALVRA